MFKDFLESVVDRTDGAIGAVIMGTDGIAVEKFFKTEASELNLDVAAAEFTSLVRGAQRTGKDTGLGSLGELIIGMKGATILLRLLTPDYFVMLTLLPDGNVGRARYELRKAEIRLSKEFAV